MAKRRPAGDGMVRKREDGRWEGRIVVGHKGSGDSIFRYISAPTQKELSANLDVTSTPLVTEHEIIFGSADRGIFALDKPTLFIKWRAETLPSLVYTAPYSSTPQAAVETSPVSSQGIVYIGASDGHLYAIDQSTGIIKDKLYFGAPVFSTVAVSGNRMIVCDFAGNVYCLSSKAAEE